MFVGDTVGAGFRGSSCTLSGISQLCSSVENSRKYRQMYSADFRSSHLSRPETSSSMAIGLPFSHSAKGWLQNHSPSTGIAAHKECGFVSQIIKPSPTDRNGIQSI